MAQGTEGAGGRVLALPPQEFVVVMPPLFKQSPQQYSLIFRQIPCVVREPLLFVNGAGDYLWEIAEQPRGPTQGTDRDRQSPVTLNVLPDCTLLSEMPIRDPGSLCDPPWPLG